MKNYYLRDWIYKYIVKCEIDCYCLDITRNIQSRKNEKSIIFLIILEVYPYNLLSP